MVCLLSRRHLLSLDTLLIMYDMFCEPTVVTYRCPAMADNCGMCLAMNKKYGCGWCQSSSKCQVRDQCDNGMGVWLNRNKTCPNPEIHSFKPSSGPWEGGTNVTIEGINLGKTFDVRIPPVVLLYCPWEFHEFFSTID